MNITEEKTGENMTLVHIKLNEDDYSGRVNSKLKEYQRKAQMPGFRPGKVPMSLIKKMYYRTVLADEMNTMVSEALNNHIAENNLELLGYPLPNEEKTRQIDIDNQKEFDFYFDIATAPKFDLKISKKIKVPYYKIKVTDEDVVKAVKDIVDRNADLKDIDEITPDAHIAVTLHETDDEGNETGEIRDADFDISEIKTKKNRELFIGKKINDKIKAVPYKLFGTKEKAADALSLENKKDQIIDKESVFEITHIYEKTLPSLDEEFFKKIYPDKEIKTVEDFQKEIRREMETMNEKEADRQLLNDVTEKLIEMADISLPDDFLKRWLLESNEGKITKEQLEEQYPSYRKSNIWSLIESKLTEDFPEELKVDEEEIRDVVRKYFYGGAIPGEKNPDVEQIVDQILSKREEKDRIAQGILEDKFTKFFKERVGKEEKEVTMDEFISIISKTEQS